MFPNIAIRIIGWIVQLLLPDATHNPVTERGMEIQARMKESLFNWITGWGRSAARRFNQQSAPPFKAPYHTETSASD